MNKRKITSQTLETIMQRTQEVGECVAEVVHGTENAHLIAAAPGLLEALKGVLRVADGATVEFDAARAAIAKAEGGAA